MVEFITFSNTLQSETFNLHWAQRRKVKMKVIDEKTPCKIMDSSNPTKKGLGSKDFLKIKGVSKHLAAFTPNRMEEMFWKTTAKIQECLRKIKKFLKRIFFSLLWSLMLIWPTLNKFMQRHIQCIEEHQLILGHSHVTYVTVRRDNQKTTPKLRF